MGRSGLNHYRTHCGCGQNLVPGKDVGEGELLHWLFLATFPFVPYQTLDRVQTSRQQSRDSFKNDTYLVRTSCIIR